MNLEAHDRAYAMIHEMKEKNVPLDSYSYNIWITICAAAGDAREMERVVQEMIADTRVGDADSTTYTTLATMYVRLGEFEKAKSCLKDAELRMTGRDRTCFDHLLGLYGSVGERDEAYRVWRLYKSACRGILNSGYRSMLSCLVKLGDVEGAEEIYEEWLAAASRLDPRICNVVVRCYVRRGRAGDAKRVLERFVEKGGAPTALSWEMLAEGFLKERLISEVLLCMEGAAAAAAAAAAMTACEGSGNWKPKMAHVADTMALCREEGKEESVGVLRRTGCLEEGECGCAEKNRLP